jgi:integral membrane protein
MTSSFDVRTTVGRLRIVAFAEALSWVGLLVGMYFKYLGTPRTEVGVQVFGPVHGVIFIAFVVLAFAAGIACSWRPTTWLWALLGSIVPLGSVIFLMWAERAGELNETHDARSADRATTQPGESISGRP